LTPVLFLIVVEGISRTLLDARISRSIEIIKMCRYLYLAHLLVVYDGSRRDASKLREILDLYCIATWMRVNVHKYSISFNGLDDKQARVMLHTHFIFNVLICKQGLSIWVSILSIMTMQLMIANS
jgi:hypothetical protein